MVYVRRSIWDLESSDPWDPYTTAYARAVEEMRKRPPDDPTSWSYQAAMHGTYAPAVPSFHWDQCQHGTWYFLPWHRMFAYFFERIVRSVVRDHGGPDDWALPFWNYSLGDKYAALPPAFRLPTWDPDGKGERPNPLYTNHRAPYYNAGNPMPAPVVALWALDDPTFLGPPRQGFGGPITGFQHAPRAFGDLENVPHNQVHVQIGGHQQGHCKGGWMVDPNCAAEDPIFWLHHSNIDRLWYVWNSLGHENPASMRGWHDIEFTFWDEHGKERTMRPFQVTDLDGLDYTYEPQPNDPRPAPVAAAEGAPMAEAEDRPAPRLLAASERSVDLSGGHAEVQVPISQPASASLRSAADPDDDSVRYVYLQIEGLSAETTPGLSWEVHVTLPEDLPGGGGDRTVGLVSFFGVNLDAEADEHGLGPLVHRFDITDLVAGVGDRAELADIAATVRFVPIGPPEATAGGVPGSPKVGRVSITAH